MENRAPRSIEALVKFETIRVGTAHSGRRGARFCLKVNYCFAMEERLSLTDSDAVERPRRDAHLFGQFGQLLFRLFRYLVGGALGRSHFHLRCIIERSNRDPNRSFPPSSRALCNSIFNR